MDDFTNLTFKKRGNSRFERLQDTLDLSMMKKWLQSQRTKERNLHVHMACLVNVVRERMLELYSD